MTTFPSNPVNPLIHLREIVVRRTFSTKWGAVCVITFNPYYRYQIMKLYNRKEVGDILKKAAENSSTEDNDTSIGLSVDELKQLASDAGIDPKQITKAVAEMEMESKRDEQNFWGGPFSFNSQVLVDGEITVSKWEEMLVSIREFFQSKGEVSTRESVWEWSSPWGTTNSAHVNVFKDNGKTKISVAWNGPLTALPFYLPIPFVAIASLVFASEFLVLSSLPGVAFVLAATGLTFLTGRWALRKHLDKAFKKMHNMIAGLELIANKSIKMPNSRSNLKDTKQVSTGDTLLEIPDIEIQNEEESEIKDRNHTRS